MEEHHEHAAGHADLLALDAEILGGYLDAATAWTAELTVREPRLVIDVGAGTGPGALALAHRFPSAQVVALDRSRLMLDRVEAAAHEHELADRITTLLVDLDETWPALGDIDVAWASSSLHEAADPRRMLELLHETLAPDGLLLVVEMDSLPRFLPEGVGPPGLQDRMHAVLDEAGWNHHPDWRPLLEQAGFDVTGQRGFPAQAEPGASGAAGYADRYLRRMRSAVAYALPADDLVALDLLLDHDSSESLFRRVDLTVHSSRTAWAAVRR